MTGKKLKLIVNPVAGKIKISTAFYDIVKVFCDAGYDVTVKITKSRGEATEIVAEDRGESDLFVICGGDGTLNEGVTGLLKSGSHTPIGYIPCGTTNDFAAGLGLERENMKTAAENIVNGKPCAIDVGEFGKDKYFSYIASFGAFTDTSYSVPQSAKNILGHLAYVLEGVKTLPNIRPIHAKLTLDDGVIEDDFIFVCISNATSIGGIVKIDSDKVNFSDGVFEVMLVKNPKTALEISKAILATQTGKYDGCCVGFHHTKKAVIETPDAVPWALDGEYGKGSTKTEISVLQRAVNIIV